MMSKLREGRSESKVNDLEKETANNKKFQKYIRKDSFENKSKNEELETVGSRPWTTEAETEDNISPL